MRLFVCGIDEAGRGPLAGPLAVGAVVLKPSTTISGLNDSKKIKEKDREPLFDQIKSKALVYSNIFIAPKEIDSINILQATKRGMYLAATDIIQKINLLYPDSENKVHFLVDGNQKFCSTLPQDTIIKGDGLIKLIGAASIIAKVSRDKTMFNLSHKHPEYGFDSHKGYPTKYHKEMIKKHGVLEIHRKTFAGVKEHILDQGI